MRFFSKLILSIFLVIPVFAYAQTQDYVIRLAVDDVTPPSAPTVLSATPVSTSQIDIDWSAATDNFVVWGYVLFRDDEAIATTSQSQTSFSDTGLTASTTYAYRVVAFDTSFNYSTTSNELATTTLAIPPEIITPPTESTAARVVLDDVVIEPGYTTTEFLISTKRPARIELRWGRTNSYELGYVVNNQFLSEYNPTVTGLEPGTTYEYQIVGYTQRGAEFLLKEGQFTTLKEEEVILPSNIRRFRSEVDDVDVRLFWELPDEVNLDYVRIVRNYLGYPTHLWDGAIAYQGLGNSVLDEGILDVYSPVYYTAFVVDKNGNVSSGAILRVDREDGDEDSSGATGDGQYIYDSNATTTNVDNTGYTGFYRIPEMSEIFIFQENYQYTFAYDSVELFNDLPFTVSIPTSAVSQNLKSMIVTIVDPTDTREQYSFLLKINGDQTAYEAVISPLSLVGASSVQVDIYDYGSKVVSTYKKQIRFTGSSGISIVGVVFPDVFIENAGITLGFLFLFLLWLLFFLYRTHRDEDKGV